jgi:uncharacterized protein
MTRATDMRDGTAAGLRAFMRRITLAALIVLAAVSARAAELDFPALSGRVVDEAGILDQATRSTLTTKLADLETRTTDQLVVVTLKSLQGLTIEDFGVRLGRHWQIGQTAKNNGVLLIVAPNERKVRFEVGYGLEGVLTDAATKLVIENSILPRFRAGDFPGGISRGVDDVVEILTGDATEWKRRAQAAQPAPVTRVIRTAGTVLSWVPEDLLFVIGIVLFGCGMSFLSMVWLFVCLPVFLHIGIRLGLVSPRRLLWLQHRQHGWQFLSMFDNAGSGSSGSSVSWSSGSSGSSWSSSDSGFSGGGGSFGGGGSSGSW